MIMSNGYDRINGNSCDIIINNGNVVIPKVGVLRTNILIENGKIKELTNSSASVNYSKSINANDKYVLPGLINPRITLWSIFTC